MSLRKRFDKELFNLYDRKARNIAKRYFAKQGIEAKDNPDKYGVDLLIYKEQQLIGYCECEVKAVWKEDQFPYGSVQIPERKAAYVYKNKLPVMFLMVNAKANRFLTVDGKDILTSPLREVSNIYLRKEELFFQVPLAKVSFHDVDK
jgi:hypothetical protein